MTRDSLKGFDPLAPDAARVLFDLREAYAARVFPARRAYADALDEEGRTAFYSVLDLLQELCRLEGAQKVVAILGKQARREAAELAAAKRQIAELEKKAAGQAAHIAQLNTAFSKLKAQRKEEPPAPEPATPTWDYKAPPRRRPRRDEVVTEAPFAVEVVARQVEEFVRRQGRCSKPDVSAAHPDLRPYLATAYRHLHESRRVRVDGWTLEPWPA